MLSEYQHNLRLCQQEGNQGTDQTSQEHKTKEISPRSQVKRVVITDLENLMAMICHEYPGNGKKG
eukprot:11812922-Prorocentrum_lima.AAC.1